jgi:WD40 repeat protein
MRFWIGILRLLILGNLIGIIFIENLFSYQLSDVFKNSLKEPAEISVASENNFFITSIFSSDEYICFSTFYRGIFVFDKKTQKEWVLDKKQGLLSNSIRKVIQSGVYIAGIYMQKNGGVFIYDVQKEKLFSYSNLNFLDTSNISDISFFKGYLYVLTGTGKIYSINIDNGDYEEIFSLPAQDKIQSFFW